MGIGSFKDKISKLGKKAKEATRSFQRPNFSSLGQKIKDAGTQLKNKFRKSDAWDAPAGASGARSSSSASNRPDNKFDPEKIREFGQQLGRNLQETLHRYPRLENAVLVGGHRIKAAMATKPNEFWITGAGIVLSAYYLSDVPALMWNKLIRVPSETPPIQSIASRPKMITDYQVIFDRCLINSQGLCKENVNPITPTQVVGAPVRTSLPIDLLGVLILEKANGEIDERSLGTIQERGSADKVYPVRAGDEVPGLLSVTEVLSDRVIFINLRNNRNEFVQLPEDQEVSRPVFNTSAAPPNTSEISNDRYRVSRQRLDSALEDLPTLITQVKASATAQGTYRLSQIVRGSLFEELGLKNNDELVSVNGENLTDPTKFLGYLEQLKSAQEVEITVKRGGQTKVIRYDIN